MARSVGNLESIATACIAERLRLLNRVITKIYDDALRPLGLKLSQGHILAVTAMLGAARPAEVSDILERDASIVSRALERMVANGRLEIFPDNDSRRYPFRLTRLGTQLMEQAIAAWENAQANATKLSKHFFG